jgi:hypothetical protein
MTYIINIYHQYIIYIINISSIYHDLYHQYTAISQNFNILITYDITFLRHSYHMVYNTHVNPYHILYHKGVIYHFLGVIYHIRTFQM